MPGTDGMWSQDSPNTDMEIFLGASEFKDQAGVATIASASAGIFTLNLATAAAGNFFANITAAVKRTGVYATPALVQEQYGTAASVPGPTLVTGTSDPEGIRGYPPYTASKLATLVGPATGPAAKGLQINSVDVIYAINTVAASLAQIGLTVTPFADNVGTFNTVNLITLGANGMPTAFRANLYKFNIPCTAPFFMTASGSTAVLNIKLTAGSGGTINFYGCVAKCSFNFN